MPKLPEWFRSSIGKKQAELKLKNTLGKDIPNCICHEAKCPNRAECFSKGQLTFLILGKICTRNCTFCSVDKGTPLPVDKSEYKNILDTISKLKLKFVVLTSPTRDDLPDGGASTYAFIVKKIKESFPVVKIEVLIPDFKGDLNALKTVIDSGPDVINHNLETVPSFYDKVRPQADFEQSLNLLQKVKEINPNILTKTGVMLGFGENNHELIGTFKAIATSKIDILTMGQYLKPKRINLDVVKYYSPDEFKDLKEKAEKIGIKHVFSGPLVRSSYLAEEIFNTER
jgi:lipoyl synthase